MDLQNKNHVYHFDKIFDQNTSQEEIFSEALPFVKNFLQGNNCSIFSFGQPGSGKTYTIKGKLLVPIEHGIILLALQYIFTQIYKIRVCILEIDNEIHDLLCNPKIKCKTLLNENSFNTADITSLAEVIYLLEETKTKSSHSHFIFQVQILGNNNSFKRCQLTFIDCASYDSQITKEIIHTQASYMNLKFIVHNLVCGKKDLSSYQNSTLTKFLQKSLKNIFLCVNVVPGQDIEETIRFLDFWESVALAAKKQRQQKQKKLLSQLSQLKSRKKSEEIVIEVVDTICIENEKNDEMSIEVHEPVPTATETRQ